MSFVLDCPACRKAVSATLELVGRVMACPHCASHFTIPQEGHAAVGVAAPRSNFPTAAGGIRFTFSCQRCNSILEARGETSGNEGKCPTCGAVFVIPSVDARTGLSVGQAVVEDDGQLPTPMHAYATAGATAPTIHRTEGGEQVIQCPRCRQRTRIDADTCSSCGMPFTTEGAAAITGAAPSTNGLATASLTVGIISMLAWCIPVPVLGFTAIGLGIGGLKRSEKIGHDKSGRNMAIAGIICGVGSTGLCVVVHYYNLW